ncbi:MAG: chorismate-binding protein [Maribacter dokdonensis]|uniref:chorismate-binding protein n=1 Tax=Maribacter dokdonensis TaxID=320912 RepID=UPI003298D94C
MPQELFDQVEICLKEQLPFVLYRKPNNAELIGIFQSNDEVHYVKDFTETGFVFAPFNLNDNAILLKMDVVIKALYEQSEINDLNQNVSVAYNEIEKLRYLNLVSSAIKTIDKGDFNKVVLSRKIEVEFKEDVLEVYQYLLNTYKKAFCYFWYHPKIGSWMGATPEILVKRKGSQFSTMSLAGTQNSYKSEMPKWSKKELDEQQLVTDYILNALKEKTVSLKSSERESVRAGQLWHLRTEIKGTFSPNNFGTVLKALHPTPAVCGTPLASAKEFILNNEMYDRSFYTGFLGELNIQEEVSRNRNRKNQENSAYRSVAKTSELFVNLRCMQLLKDKAAIYVGGGITKDSNPESEWEETTLKSMTMLRVLSGN